MMSMTRRRGLQLAGCLVLVTPPLTAGTIGVPGRAATAATEAWVQSDVPTDSGSTIVSTSVLDSTGAVDSTLVMDSLTALGPAEDAEALAARLKRLTVAAASLPPDERLVFDEVVAAAREMLASGDLDATRLLAADAVDVLRRGSR